MKENVKKAKEILDYCGSLIKWASHSLESFPKREQSKSRKEEASSELDRHDQRYGETANSVGVSRHQVSEVH